MPTKPVERRSAFEDALKGGLSGGSAMAVQVSSLMWLRTTMNYQYRHGTGFRQSLRELYLQGGIRRFYRGLVPAVTQATLCRFGDTAANVGVLQYLNASKSTEDLPIIVKTFCASGAAAGWRVLLMPIDSLRLIMQIDGKEGPTILANKVRSHGVKVLYHGSLATSCAALIGHFCWFSSFNFLDANLPLVDSFAHNLLRNGFMGFFSSAFSDCLCNSLYIVKTHRQVNSTPISYLRVAASIIERDGLRSILGRGLTTRLLANGLQGLVFSVSWKLFQGWSVDNEECL